LNWLEDHELELVGKRIKVVVGRDLRLAVLAQRGRVLWESSASGTPAAVVRRGDGAPREVPLADAEDVSACAFYDGTYRGQKLRLAGLGGVDVVLEVVFAIDAGADELMIQVERVGGADTVVGVERFYRIEKPVADGGYLALPHGSGYLVPAGCPDEVPADGGRGDTVGGRWTMPLFGMVKGDEGLAAIVDTWWDCKAHGEHRPGRFSALEFNWLPSLGRLAYPRRLRLRFARGMDHLGMAKLYRAQAGREGLLRTLEEKMAATPQLRRYLDGMLVRWTHWNPAQIQEVLGQVRTLVDAGWPINFFFPKWPSIGHKDGTIPSKTCNNFWQAFLHPDPVPGGWAALVDFNEQLKAMGCLVQGFINIKAQEEGAPGYDPARLAVKPDGTRHDKRITVSDEVERNLTVLKSLKERGLRLDVLYYDGSSAHHDLPEDFSEEHPCTRRDVFEIQGQCFADTRAAGIMPGAELTRFWAVPDCDYWFYTDWAHDRLSVSAADGTEVPVGVPIPWFQLVFHDCYLAGFSGGGYSAYIPGYDWWQDRNPRLYELLFVATPCHNWLPGGVFPYDRLNSPEARPRWDWLRKMSAMCKATKLSEMTSHRFLSEDRTQQRTEFANGVNAEFNMAANRFRVEGVDGFTGDWESPPENL